MAMPDPGSPPNLTGALLEAARSNRREETIRLLVERLSAASGVKYVAGAFLGDAGSTLLYRMGHSGWVDEQSDGGADDVLLECLRTGQQVCDPQAEGVGLARPLWVGDSVMGALGIGGDPIGEFASMLDDAVALGVITLENADLRRMAARSVTEVATVLSALIESRDSYTESHCVALAEMSVAVGIRLGVDDERLTVLNLAGHMHDIGKVSIPDAVLLKPGPLTDDEFKVMQSHSSVGEAVLERIRDFSEVAPVVGQHHERFDGDGYPKGLRGDDILLEARILAVADAFDAMTSSRPYRRALSEAAALEEIRVCSGSQFDPEIADVFLQYLEGEQAQWKRHN